MTGSSPWLKWLIGVAVAVSALLPVVTGCSAPLSPTSRDVASEVALLFRQVLPQLEAETEIPVLLPGEIPLPDSDVYIDAETTSQEYAVHLGYVPDCRGTACFIGMFAGKRTEGAYYAGELFEETVALANGIEGHFNPVRCAASCGPAVIEWAQGGVRYRFALKAFSADSESEKEAMVQLANSAIAAGDRGSRRRPG